MYQRGPYVHKTSTVSCRRMVLTCSSTPGGEVSNLESFSLPLPFRPLPTHRKCDQERVPQEYLPSNCLNRSWQHLTFGSAWRSCRRCGRAPIRQHTTFYCGTKTFSTFPLSFENSSSPNGKDDSNPVHCLGERPTGQSIHVQDWNKTYLRQRNQIVLHHLERFTHNNTCVAEKTTLVLGNHPSIHHRPIVCAIGSKLFHCTPFVRYEPQQVSTHPVHGCQILQR